MSDNAMKASEKLFRDGLSDNEPATSEPSASEPSLAELFSAAERKKLASLGVSDLHSLLRLRPRRYQIPAPLKNLHSLTEGTSMSAIVQVTDLRQRRMRQRPGYILDVSVTDNSDQITLTFFLPKKHMLEWHRQRLQIGATILVRGTVSSYRGEPQLTHPEYEPCDDTPAERERITWPLPVYSLTSGVSQDAVRGYVRKALPYATRLAAAIPHDAAGVDQRSAAYDAPSAFSNESSAAPRGRSATPNSRCTSPNAGNLPTFHDAVRMLHEPHSPADIACARTYFAFEEALVISAVFAQRRWQDAHTPAPSLPGGGTLHTALTARLPFDLTPSQLEVGEQLAEHLAQPHPANVLLQGDVGAGKTVVALRAMLQAVDAGFQAALLAPTEVLAQQHHRTITTLMGELARAGHLDAPVDATRVRLLTGSMGARARQETLLDVTSGQAGIVVGTHALLTDTVQFASLGVVVIDEQHRFGVEHRRQLREKGPDGQAPHMIVMTATPIPRTAALMTAGDLDLLTLRERPGTRAGVESFVVPEQRPKWLQRMHDRMAEEIAAGHAVFVVCPHIDAASEGADGSSAATSPTRGAAAEARTSSSANARASKAVTQATLAAAEDADFERQLAALLNEAPASGSTSLPEPATSPAQAGAPGQQALDLAASPPVHTVTDVAKQLTQIPQLKDARIGIVHGRLGTEEKTQVMQELASGELDIVVATTVIEVGVDVPHATVMAVMDAERFGISQLHQLRGRVGRSEHAGQAFFVTRLPEEHPGMQRLQHVAATTDGFALADLDLQERGMGDVIGVQQSGVSQAVQYLDPSAHGELMLRAREFASVIVGNDPDLGEHEGLRAAIERRMADSAEVERS